MPIDQNQLSNFEYFIQSSLKKDAFTTTPIIAMDIKGIKAIMHIITNKNDNIVRFSISGEKQFYDLFNVINNNSTDVTITDKNGNIQKIIMPEMDLKETEPGNHISISAITPSGKLDKKIFSLKQNKDSWKVVKEKTKNKINLTSDRSPGTQSLSLQRVITSPFKIIGAILGVIFDIPIISIPVNSIIEIFSDINKIIKKKIISACKENCINNYIPEKEINKIAEEIALKYTSNKFTDDVPHEAHFNKFLEISKNATLKIAEKIVSYQIAEKLSNDKKNIDELINSSLVKNTTEIIIADLIVCLDNSSDSIQVTTCTNKFIDSVPYRIGKEVLKNKFKDNFQDKLTNPIDFADSETNLIDNYDSCMFDKYFTYQSNIKAASVKEQQPPIKKNDCTNLKNEGLEITQSCVLGAFISSTRDIANKTINSTLLPFFKDKSELYLSSNRKLSQTLSNCFWDKKLITRNGEAEQINYQYLSSLETSVFEKDMQHCVTLVAKAIAVEVTKETI